MVKYYLEFRGNRYSLSASTAMDQPFSIAELPQRDYIYLQGAALDAVLNQQFKAPHYDMKIVKETIVRVGNKTTITTEDLCTFHLVHRITDV